MSAESVSYRSRPIFFLALAAVLLLGGQWLRVQAGIEFDAESVRAWVERQGILAPLLFVLLVAGRQFVLIPSAFILSAGGLLFGAWIGTVLGAIGLVGSAVVTFVIARGLGGDRVRSRIAGRFPMFDRYVESTGPLLVFMTIAYPAGPMTLVFWAAGFSSLRFASLIAAVASGGLVRSGAYSFFGSTLADAGSSTFWLATVVLGLALVVPLAHSGLRRRLFKPVSRPSA